MRKPEKQIIFISCRFVICETNIEHNCCFVCQIINSTRLPKGSQHEAALLSVLLFGYSARLVVGWSVGLSFYLSFRALQSADADADDDDDVDDDDDAKYE